MSFAIDEKLESRPGSDTQRDLVYVARGSDPNVDTDEAAIAAVFAAAPSTHGGLAKSRVTNVREFGNESGWEITVHYGDDLTASATTYEIGNATLLSFTTIGATQRITQSYKTVDWSAATSAGGKNAAPDFKNAIGIGPDGVPAGTDAPVPICKFRVRKKYAPGDITAAYLGNLILMSGRKNGASWSVTFNYGLSSLQLIFRAGEAIFYGADVAEPDRDGNTEITFDFGAAPNLENYIPQPGWPAINKRGWDYLWFTYKQQMAVASNTTTKYLASLPTAAYVEEIALDGDFSVLNLPA